MARKDGKRFKGADMMYTIVPYVMDKRCDSCNSVTVYIPYEPMHEYIVKKRAEGIETKDVRISPHTLRHFFAVQSLKQGRDLYSISTQLGHESLQITSIYLKTLAQEDIVKMAKSNSVLMNL